MDMNSNRMLLTIMYSAHLYPHKHWCIPMYKTAKLMPFFQLLVRLTCEHDMNQPDQMIVMDAIPMAIDLVTLDYSPGYCCVTSFDEMSRLDW